MPVNSDDLTTAYNYQQYLDVAADDTIRVEQCSTGGFTLHEFKKQNVNATDFIYITWNGQSGRAPSSSGVHLQVWDFDGAHWEDMTENNEAAANTDFTMSGSVTSDLDHYYGAGNWVYFRVWQEGV